jgi:hypothetical protein
MRTTTIACDRCSVTIDGTFSILEVKHGDLARQFDGPLDLCATCSGALADFLRSPEPYRLEATADDLP